MNGKRILGILIAMTMALTIIPGMLEPVSAVSDNINHTPSYLVIIRDVPDPNPRIINKTIGNVYQDDKFGVEVIAHVDHYNYVPGTSKEQFDSVILTLTGIGVKTDRNDWYYQIRWLEIDATKFSFQPTSSHITPHATDYNASLQAKADTFASYGLHCESHSEIKWFSEISGTIAGTATSIATVEGGPIASALTATAVSELVKQATKHVLSQSAPEYLNYDNAALDPWSSSSNQETSHIYMALKGGTYPYEDPEKVLLSRILEWDLYDNINNRVHVLTLKVTLDYAHWEIIDSDGSGFWMGDHRISTTVTIYIAPQSMVKTDSSGRNILNIAKSDPSSSWSYFLEVANHISYSTAHYSENMPIEDTSTTPRGDTTSSHKVDLMLGNDEDNDLLDITEHYYYYMGALPPGDSEDWCHMDFIIDMNHYSSNTMHLWIFATNDIVVHLNFYGTWNTIHIEGGTSWDLNKKYVGDGSDRWADIEITKDSGVDDAAYIISAYVSYQGYGEGPDGPPNSGSGGCPFLYAYSRNGWQMENNVLVWAENATRSNLEAKDYYLFNATENNGSIKLGIGEPGEDVDYIDAVELYKVMAPSGYDIAESYDGKVYAYRAVESGIAKDNSGENITLLVNSVDGNYWVGNKGDYIDITLNLSRKNLLIIRGIDNPPNITGNISTSAVRPPVTLSTIWLYGNISNKWIKLGEIKVRHKMHTNVVNLNHILHICHIHHFSGSKIELRFEMRDRNGIDFIGLAHDYRIVPLRKVKLENSSYGYEKIRIKDGNYLRINPGEFTKMNFKSKGNGLYLLVVYGFYFNHEKIGKGIGIVKECETNIAEAKLQSTLISGENYVLLPLLENYSGICCMAWYVDGQYMAGELPVVNFASGEHTVVLYICRWDSTVQQYTLFVNVS